MLTQVGKRKTVQERSSSIMGGNDGIKVRFEGRPVKRFYDTRLSRFRSVCGGRPGWNRWENFMPCFK